MNADQIAELRKDVGIAKTWPPWEFWGRRCGMPYQTLERLLEERERLLAALKIEPHCCGQEAVAKDHEAIVAAIAFAEEAAP